MLEPDFDPIPTAVQIGRCGYQCPCRAPRCTGRKATIVLRKIDAAGRLDKSSSATAMRRPYLRANASAASRYSTARLALTTPAAALKEERESGRSRSLFPSVICPSGGGLLTHWR